MSPVSHSLRYSGGGFLTSAILLCFMQQAAAQDFSNSITIGDSNSDSGRFYYLTDPIGGSLATTGAFTTRPDLMWSEALGQKFGIRVTTSAAPGGGNNYAAGGATVATVNGGKADPNYSNEWSGQQQVQAYLSDVGQKADPNALYTIFIGNNDLHSWFNLAPGLPDLVDNTVSGGAPNPLPLTQRQTAIVSLAGQTADLVLQLHNAGARYFLVPGDYTIGSQEAANAVNYVGKTTVAWDPATATAVKLYNSSMWNQIAAKGINFIPADFFTVANYVILNPSRFGVTNTDWTQPVCGAVLSINCTQADWVGGRTGSNSLFADSNGHLAGVGQQIEADYSYGLIVAPGQVSTLGNHALLTQLSQNDNYLNQIEGGFRAQSTGTVGYWLLGAVQHGRFEDTTSMSSSLSNDEGIGFDYQYSPKLLLGGFVDHTIDRVQLPSDGRFDQSGTTFGAYAGVNLSGFWANGMASYNWLSTDLKRTTPIGITNFTNTSDGIRGSSITLAVTTGYSFQKDNLQHGPVFGYSYINTVIDGFTESGNFNSLHFDRQSFDSNIVSGGYKVNAEYGQWEPSLKATYNSILGSANRNVTASLTTTDAPSFYLPAATYDKNWFNVMAGLAYKFNDKFSLRATISDRVAEKSVAAYGGTLSLTGKF